MAHYKNPELLGKPYCIRIADKDLKELKRRGIKLGPEVRNLVSRLLGDASQTSEVAPSIATKTLECANCGSNSWFQHENERTRLVKLQSDYQLECTSWWQTNLQLREPYFKCGKCDLLLSLTSDTTFYAELLEQVRRRESRLSMRADDFKSNYHRPFRAGPKRKTPELADLKENETTQIQFKDLGPREDHVVYRFSDTGNSQATVNSARVCLSQELKRVLIPQTLHGQIVLKQYISRLKPESLITSQEPMVHLMSLSFDELDRILSSMVISQRAFLSGASNIRNEVTQASWKVKFRDIDPQKLLAFARNTSISSARQTAVPMLSLVATESDHVPNNQVPWRPDDSDALLCKSNTEWNDLWLYSSPAHRDAIANIRAGFYL